MWQFSLLYITTVQTMTLFVECILKNTINLLATWLSHYKYDLGALIIMIFLYLRRFEDYDYFYEKDIHSYIITFEPFIYYIDHA